MEKLASSLSSPKETPRQYLQRITHLVSKTELTEIIAKNTPFMTQVLSTYMDQFDLTGVPVDFALRQFFLECYLPKEAQLIDRIINAFASKYHKDNPNLFPSADCTYLISFALVLLQTDLHNPNNRRKMTRDQFVWSARQTEGGQEIPAELLEILYDNTSAQKFAWPSKEDEIDVDGQKMFTRNNQSLAIRNSSLSSSSTSSGWFPKWLLSFVIPPTLHASTNSCMSAERETLHPVGNQYPFSLVDHHSHGQLLAHLNSCTPDPQQYTTKSSESHIVDYETITKSFLNSSTGPSSLFRLAKEGMLRRKMDRGETGRRATVRSWRALWVVLSGSQLLFFKEVEWFAKKEMSDEPRSTTPKPFSVLSTAESICVIDKDLNRSKPHYKNVFRLSTPSGRQYLLQAESNTEMTEWMALINYAAAYKSVGLRVRGVGESIFFDQNNVTQQQVFTREEEFGHVEESESGGGGELNVCRTVGGMRADVLKSKIDNITRHMDVAQGQISSELRLVRHLHVAIPLTKSTRDKVLDWANSAQRRVRCAALEVERLKCYRDILQADLQVEEKSTGREEVPRQQGFFGSESFVVVDEGGGGGGGGRNRTFSESERTQVENKTPPRGSVSTESSRTFPNEMYLRNGRSGKLGNMVSSSSSSSFSLDTSSHEPVELSDVSQSTSHKRMTSRMEQDVQRMLGLGTVSSDSLETSFRSLDTGSVVDRP